MAPASIALSLNAAAAKSLERGHPWVFREAVRGKAEMGDVVELAVDGRFVARGIFDAASPIAVRVYTRDPRERLDRALFSARIERAWAKRDELFDASTTMMRIVNGEGDRLPAVVVDRYGPVAVVRLDGEAIATWKDDVIAALVPLAKRRGVETVLLRRAAAREGDAKTDRAHGPDPGETIEVLEHGARVEVDLAHGQKTGAFIDQRENRRRVRDLVRTNGRALNLFSYTGGFSLAAALGGAREVVSVDVAAKAHATAQRIFRLNGVDPTKHRFVSADALAHLAELERRGEAFDLVVSDPPSFAPNEKSKQRGLAAYAKLHRACARVLAKGGTLCLASCSSHVSLEDFLGVADDRALDRSDLSVCGAWGPPEDHPTLAGFPEGRYLKFVVLR
ncbi:MAG: class I SAM-dependent rRNA methyltransferase [Polyangiaceae bacterium]